jgi:hypothetical protein
MTIASKGGQRVVKNRMGGEKEGKITKKGRKKKKKGKNCRLSIFAPVVRMPVPLPCSPLSLLVFLVKNDILEKGLSLSPLVLLLAVFFCLFLLFWWKKEKDKELSLGWSGPRKKEKTWRGSTKEKRGKEILCTVLC